ncbi:hypothetical protein FHX52_4039 [Humibacillus xanthopallidus]|uniref:(2Fe-2S) ferredoxin domain-containing protein n=1 Tax=Humibacillus xanthopallidus TaxID=412689 RepID=A0A543PL66_9MICO|nr:hypothetical protein [Humibacillus xanthopallidus]TQN44818.1 hypothetical protein FHX52_4039 [Humibacillus xanthopallidus]
MTAYGDGVCTLRVCRDCCCGTQAKHPGVDHEGLLTRLEVDSGDHARVLRSDCLLACDESNVVVITPSPSGRRRGGRPVWVRRVLDDAAVDAIVDWVRAGGPGISGVPGGVRERVFAATSLARSYAGR